MANFALRKLMKMELLTTKSAAMRCFGAPQKPARRCVMPTATCTRGACLLGCRALTCAVKKCATPRRALSGQYDQASRAAASF